MVPFAKQPELGHKTARASVGAGWRNNDTFDEVAVRAAYHDLLDPEVGYTPDAQIEIASLAIRHYNRADQTRIERATFANVLSLSPIDSVFHAPSWNINVGMNTIRFGSCQLCSNGVINGGIGGAIEPDGSNGKCFSRSRKRRETTARRMSRITGSAGRHHRDAGRRDRPPENHGHRHIFEVCAGDKSDDLGGLSGRAIHWPRIGRSGWSTITATTTTTSSFPSKLSSETTGRLPLARGKESCYKCGPEGFRRPIMSYTPETPGERSSCPRPWCRWHLILPCAATMRRRGTASISERAV